ncbi:MAG: hypothetical protein NW203_01155 [Hyphomonadaceae bacterium]|nr:hypothetical protein [Hyphomonadaceae bacterium]
MRSARAAFAVCFAVAAASAPVWATPDAPPTTEVQAEAPVVALSPEALAVVILDRLDEACLAETETLAAVAEATLGQDIAVIVDAIAAVRENPDLCASEQAALRAAQQAAELAQSASDATGAGPEGQSPFAPVGVPGGAGGASYLG